MYLKEISQCAQRPLINLSLTTNIIGGDLYDHLMRKRTFTLIMNKSSSKIMSEVGVKLKCL